MIRRTHVSIQAEKLFLNGAPTYADRIWNGWMIEGLLFHARPTPAALRQVPHVIDLVQQGRRHGLLALHLNLQEPLAGESAFTPEGALWSPYFAHLEQVLDEADWLRMVVILSLFGGGQSALRDERAVRRALQGALDWLTARRFRNVLLLVDEAERLAIARSHPGQVLAGYAIRAGQPLIPELLHTADFLWWDGAGLSSPEQVTQIVAELRGTNGYRPMPILLDGGQHGAAPMQAAIAEYASWGCGFADVGLESQQAFFALVREATGV